MRRSIRLSLLHLVRASILKVLSLEQQLNMVDKKADQPPSGQEVTIHGSTMGTAAPHIAFASEKETVDQPTTLEHVHTNVTIEDDKNARKSVSVETLGIPDWEAKQKKLVRTLNMTLLPQLWILYMFNYLNRTNIA
jgi:hypothetical protein